jgi:hypothetical protein
MIMALVKNRGKGSEEPVMKKNLRFVAEPRDRVYRRLLQFAARQANTLYVVVRDQIQLSDDARHTLSILEPSLVSVLNVTEWPGTKLLAGREARLFTYRTSASIMKELETCAGGLYGWIAPDLPEDLGFRRSDGSVWLASIAHERDAWLELELDELKELHKAYPEIEQMLQPG